MLWLGVGGDHSKLWRMTAIQQQIEAKSENTRDNLYRSPDLVLIVEKKELAVVGLQSEGRAWEIDFEKK
jgi:hypothetical protein